YHGQVRIDHRQERRRGHGFAVYREPPETASDILLHNLERECRDEPPPPDSPATETGRWSRSSLQRPASEVIIVSGRSGRRMGAGTGPGRLPSEARTIHGRRCTIPY